MSHIINRLGEERENYFNAISPPVMQTSNYAFESVMDFRKKISTEFESHVYTRGNNPTVEILRKKLAALEHTEDCLVFGSGVAAVAAAVMANISQGEHIVCVRSAYSWTKTLLQKYLPRFGVSHSFVDGRYIDHIEAAILPNTRILYLESPNSMIFELQDLEACAALAKKYGLVTILDNSYCSPIFQQPADFGIDLVLHSGTKYINGHSDVVMGVLCGKREMIKKIFYSEFMNIGHILSPHDAFLAIRGLRTLPLRVQRSHETCAKLMEALQNHPKVEKIHHPFIDEQQALAVRQMKGGGMFTLALKAARKEQVIQFCDSLENFLIAVSWGGHESLIMPVVTFYDIPGQPDPELPWNLVRFYIGLEDPHYLLADILQALDRIS
ncbi:MAG TPA: aminotransferase class I/II-fold pyridoxal phosphate-dependent enzyme [Saprospiraceae bacterium]|nr:aminotransferase class I/II-fold pyridoxal phosphate-dependent enzyme [Saprospiraceae bacterium]HNT21259.1 aminotransferase class I/II-fold pyridoxal phosphate-dependent enzyme [Saprospiraceae bacterium]